MALNDDFVKRASVLKNVQFGEVSGRLAALFDWMEQQQPIHEIMEEVRRRADGEALILKGDFHTPPPAHTPDEIVSVGLILMDACHKEDFANVCLSRGIGPSYNTSAVQPYVDEGLQRYVIPFLAHVEGELLSSKLNYMPDKIAERRFDEIILGEAFQSQFPTTYQHVGRIAGEFLRADHEVSWQNIGNSCRQALLEFCNECAAKLDPKLSEEIKRGNVKAIAREIIRRRNIEGRFASALETLIAAVWDYAQPLTHRSTSTREDAARLYLWTGLAISELAGLFENNS
jgi:hypothetical protein